MMMTKMKIKKDTFFCSKCLISDYYFIGGGSWVPEYCPKCRGIEVTIYSNLNIWKKIKAKRLFKKMKKKENNK